MRRRDDFTQRAQQERRDGDAAARLVRGQVLWEALCPSCRQWWSQLVERLQGRAPAIGEEGE